jgi:Tfp pilus assembly protein PilN
MNMASPNQLSFLPEDYMEKKLRRRTNAILGTLFLIVVSAIGGTLFWKEQMTRELMKQKSALDSKMGDAARPIEQFKAMQDKQRMLAHQAELTASLLERVPRSYLLAEITNGIPGGVSLLDFQMDSRIRVQPTAAAPKTAFEQRKAEVDTSKQAPAMAQPRIYDVGMKITGLATTDVQVAQFMNKLNRSPLFKDVNLLISDEYKQGQDVLRKFQIEMSLNPEAQISSSDAVEKTNKTAAVPVTN